MAQRVPTVTVIGLFGVSWFFSVARFPARGETVVSSSLLTEPGGKGFNQAVAAARLGAAVHFITSVGNDPFGTQCAAYLAAEGIHAPYIAAYDCPTAAAAIMYDQAGDSEVVVYPGASRRLSRDDVARNRDVIAASDVLVVQNEMPAETLEAAVAIAADAGTRVVFNPAPAGRFAPWLLECVDVITPNEGEAAALAGLPADTPPGDVAAALHRLGAKRVVITLGERGALVSEEGHTTAIEPLRVQAVDTTGAGDAFTAALAVALARGWDLPAAARYAAAAGALTVTKRGVLAALPYKSEVDAAYARLATGGHPKRGAGGGTGLPLQM